MTARFERPSAINLKNVEDFAQYMDAVLGEIERALNESSTHTQQVKIHREPAKKTEGLTVLADGSDWNPGDGEGLYRWNGSAWVKIDNSSSTVTAAGTLTDDQFVVGAGGARGVETVTAAQARNLIGLDSDDNVTFHSLTVHGTTGGDPTLTVRGTTGNPKVEIGRQDGSVSIPHIDFHSGATLVDYDARIRGDGGTGVSGGGSLNIQCASLLFNGNNLAIVQEVASGSVASAATLDIALGSADVYEIDLVDFRPATDTVDFRMLFSQSGTFLTGASDYKWDVQKAGLAANDSADAQIRVVDGIGNVSPSEGVGVTLKIYRPSNTSERKNAYWYGHKVNPSTVYEGFIGVGQLALNTGAIDGARFLFSSGNIASGVYAVRSYSFT